MIGIVITIFGGLGLFLFGMKTMSEGLQFAAGDRLRNILWKATSNRFKGVLTGFGITTIIQSSSAATVMLVSFVSAGLINLIQASGIVLGANIGTTVTGWLVALVGFKVKIKALALPAIAIGYFIRFLKIEKAKTWGDVLLGFGILFLGLSIMSGSVKELRGSQGIMDFMSTYRASDMFTTIVVVLIGALITMIIQSSSATMAMTMTLAAAGIIDFYTAAALILGENIGTTITANIAAIGSSLEARRTARVHMLFNVLGVIWVLILFRHVFIPFVDMIVPGNPFVHSPGESSVIADHMAAFHTVFNISNTLLFLPFLKYLAMAAEKLVPGEDDLGEFHLKYISTAIISTPSININQAKLEAKSMLELVSDMYDLTMEVMLSSGKKMGKSVEKIYSMEDRTDLLEREISSFLVKVSRENLSKDQSNESSVLLQKVNDLESIADQCESLTILLRRKYDKNLDFSEKGVEELKEIAGKVREFLDLILKHAMDRNLNIMPEAEVLENTIDDMRRKLRKEHIKRLNSQKCSVDSGLIFIDMLSSFEKIGDHAYNIAEGISGLRNP